MVFKNVNQIGSLIFSKPANGLHLRVKAKVFTIKKKKKGFTINAPHISPHPHSLSSSPITLSPVHPTPTILVSLLLFEYVKATPSWDLPLYLLFPLPAMLLSATHRLTPPAVRSLLKCHLTRGIFLVTYIKRQFLLETPNPFIQVYIFSIALITIGCAIDLFAYLFTFSPQ